MIAPRAPTPNPRTLVVTVTEKPALVLEVGAGAAPLDATLFASPDGDGDEDEDAATKGCKYKPKKRMWGLPEHSRVWILRALAKSVGGQLLVKQLVAFWLNVSELQEHSISVLWWKIKKPIS